MAIKDVVAAVDTVVKSKVTLSSTSVYPNEEQRTGLFAVTFEESGRYEMRSAGWAQSFHSVVSYILGPRTNMLQTYKSLEGKCEDICKALAGDETLGGTCDTFLEASYAMGNLEVAGVAYVGYKITINGIKMPRVL